MKQSLRTGVVADSRRSDSGGGSVVDGDGDGSDKLAKVIAAEEVGAMVTVMEVANG